jgi:hypothetical protein
MLTYYFSAFFFHGTSRALQPSFYPTEAESKGATPSQVRVQRCYFAFKCCSSLHTQLIVFSVWLCLWHCKSNCIYMLPNIQLRWQNYWSKKNIQHLRIDSGNYNYSLWNTHRHQRCKNIYSSVLPAEVT